ncbi:MAG: hypothetical protein Fur0037_23440 [Planctomycetota bacterium]
MILSRRNGRDRKEDCWKTHGAWLLMEQMAAARSPTRTPAGALRTFAELAPARNLVEDRTPARYPGAQKLSPVNPRTA